MEIYDLKDLHFQTSQRYMISAIYANNKKTLDVGCCVGYGTYILSDRGNACEVLGIDINKEHIEFAKKVWKHEKIIYQNASLYDIKEKFDLVVALEIVEHIENPIEDTISKLKNLLNENGILIFSCPENEKAEPNETHIHTNIQRKDIVDIIKNSGLTIKTILIEEAVMGINGDYNDIMAITQN